MFYTTVNVRYQETDKMGIAHHSVYPIWFEEARTNFIKNIIGISYTEIEKRGVLLPLVSLSCKYIKPAFYEDVLAIHTKILNLTNVTITFEYNIFKNNAIITKGTTQHPFLDKNFNIINLKKYDKDLFCLINSVI